MRSFLLRQLLTVKPCGHPHHPEDGNVGRIGAAGPRVDRGADVEAHRSEPAWFVGRVIKLRFVAGEHSEHVEFMWVAVDSVATEFGVLMLRGRLANDPVKPAIEALVRCGDEVKFTVDEILDVAR
jgi:hypothetical protein